jgi:hypothetical protein
MLWIDRGKDGIDAQRAVFFLEPQERSVKEIQPFEVRGAFAARGAIGSMFLIRSMRTGS